MQKANQILQAIRKMGEHRIPLTRVYRNLFSEDLFLAAYGKIYRNEGALTPGIDPTDTADGMSLDIIHNIIEKLRKEQYRFRPARRMTIPKKSGGARGINAPGFSDKLVQEALRLMLEAYYEPRFRESSHGFRAGRGCHTALQHVHTKFQGAKWLIEGDIKGCFDNINHAVLLNILSRDIQDGRLLNLIRLGLEAGFAEYWTYHKTYSGTPQGGILSPILANIYMHELDEHIEDVLIPQYTRGKQRATNPDYRRYEWPIKCARKQGNDALAHKLEQERRQIPFGVVNDPTYRRLSYVRYADDFILGFAGSKSEAIAIKEAIRTFLQQRLKLTLSEEKTLITHAQTEKARFLGYAVSIYQADDKLTRRTNSKTKGRSINGGVRLGVPYGLTNEKAKQYQENGKVVSERRLLDYSDTHIIDVFQSRFRGIAEYYKYATDRCHLRKLQYIMQIALVKTLAHKYRISASQVYRKYRGKLTVDNHDYTTLQLEVPTKHGSRLIYWGAIPLRTVKIGQAQLLHDQQYQEQFKNTVDLLVRLKADVCELCGSTDRCQVHHIRKLAELKKRWAGRKEKPRWVTRMIAMQRKTLIVCFRCHRDIHNGVPTPIKREEVLESRVI